MRRVTIIALAAVMAGAWGSLPAYASDSADAYSFFAGERARLKAAASPAPALPKPRLAAGGEQAASAVESGKAKPSRKRTVRRKPAGPALDRIAPAYLAENGSEAPRRTVAGGKPLGYHAPARDRYRALIARHAAANGVPYALGDAVVRVESRYQPHVSNGGAVGLMQIKPATARGLGFSGTAKGLMHPETNIKYGMKYLGQAYRLAKGDTCGTVMRYQSGHYATRINRANLAYCAKVRTIVASHGAEVAAADVPGGGAKTRVE